MRTYIGKKEIKAEYLNEEIAVEKGYARANEDGHEWRQGYHVQYTNPDGSTYDSWSPRDVFERAYRPADTFLDRLYLEYTELYQKYKKIGLFLDKGADKLSKEIGATQVVLLMYQHKVMSAYLDVLNTRIANIKCSSSIE